MAVIEVQDIYKKDGNGIFQPLRGNYVKDANGIFQQFKPGSGVKSADGNWYVLKELIKHIRDPKDNQLYPVKLMPDGNWWMNTNYAYAGNGVVYNNDETHRPYYGGMYDFDTAMANAWDGVALPSESQWDALFESFGGRSIAGRMLKSKLNTRDNGANSPTNPAWTYSSDDVLGIDQYDFGIVPAGVDFGGYYILIGKSAYFFSSDSEITYSFVDLGIGANKNSGAFDASSCASVRYMVTDNSILI